MKYVTVVALIVVALAVNGNKIENMSNLKDGD